MSCSERDEFLKGKDGLTFGAFPDLFSQHFRGRKIDRYTEHFGEAILQSGHIQQREALLSVELGY